MSQRQSGSQLTLVFSNSQRKEESATEDTRLSSVRCKMLRAGSPTRSRKTDSPFIARMRELELKAPDHAAVLLGLANDILDDQLRRGWPPLE